MPEIKPPRLPEGHPDRYLDAEFYLEPAFDELADTAKASGWSEDEVEAALLGLAKAPILARIERAATDHLIERFKRLRS
jgi:hypothetical protein